ncbi:hypothetical protein, partial [Acinetobacter oleivorans]|uniref:hypothetical protein n=1 Tax=Acinetobacter oleivorans TaxID=1148157 RepID=UPI004062AEC1
MANKQTSKTTTKVESDSAFLNDLLRDYLASDDCDENVRRYLTVSLAENTVRAYLCDVKHFLAWGGAIPAKPELIAKYIAHYGQKHAGSTLSRRLVAIGRTHTARGLQDPTKSRLVRATLQGVRRSCGSQLKQAAPIQK